MQLAEVMTQQIASWKGKVRGGVLNPDDGKMQYLESIRGLAALVVVFAHILTFFFPSPDVNTHALSHGSTVINGLFYGHP